MSAQIDVLSFQRMAKCAGLYPGNLDSRWGPQTQAASDQFDALYKAHALKYGSFDPRSEGNIHTLAPIAQVKARQLLVAAADHRALGGAVVKIISGNRTYAEQDRIYAQGRSTPGNVVTNARGGYSNHNFWIAFDVGVWVGGEYYDGSDQSPTRARAEEQAYINLAGVVKAAVTGILWGGDWVHTKDRPHYECAVGGRQIADVRAMYERGEQFWTAVP